VKNGIYFKIFLRKVGPFIEIMIKLFFVRSRLQTGKNLIIYVTVFKYIVILFLNICVECHSI
jgi:hypothetical protein